MTRVDQQARILALLRVELERAAKAKKSDRPRARASAKGALSRLGELKGLFSLPREDVERALVGALLTDAFGDVANGADFQDATQYILRMLRQEPSTDALLQRAVATLVSAER